MLQNGSCTWLTEIWDKGTKPNRQLRDGDRKLANRAAWPEAENSPEL
jgi:hypothetical protein